jgi:two-component system osmolarity sensor histidine kinase EnvZ
MLLQELVVQFKPLDIRFDLLNYRLFRHAVCLLKRLIGNLINNSKRYGAEPIELRTVENEHILISVADQW